MPTGTCKLCLEKKELRDSHLIPAGVLKLLRDPKKKNPNPVMFTSTIALQTPVPAKAHLLCEACEDRFSKNGETWVIGNLARLGSFPLRDTLVKETPLVSDPKLEITIYAAAKNPKIQMDKLVYFGLSIFWRSGAYKWRNVEGKVEAIDLGPYKEPIRRYLLGKEPFPKHIAVIISLWPTEGDAFMGVSYPHLVARRDHHDFGLYVPGVEFNLLTGKSIPANLYRMCSYSSTERPIFVSPLATSDASSSMEYQARTARLSKGVKALFENAERAPWTS